MFSTLRRGAGRPFRFVQDRLGLAGIAVAVVALILALGGSALAKGLFTKAQEKKIVQIAKKYAGKPGPAGEKGAAGDRGPQGPQGSPGAPGQPGSSVTNTVEPKGTKCKEGGTKFEGTSTTYACNGSPWTAGGTLPSGEIETGTWAGTFFNGTVSMIPLSFPIPLLGELDFSHVHIINEGETGGPGCTGGTVNSPKTGIEKGHLCVYVLGAENATPLGIFKAGEGEQGASTMGARLLLAASPGKEAETAQGTFAVRAP